MIGDGQGRVVFLPLMPKGVEHNDYEGFKVVFEQGVPSVDAERR